MVHVPNAEIFTSRITNNTAAPVRRDSVELFLGYDQGLSHAVAVVQETTQTAEGVLNEPKASVRVRNLGQEDIVIEARFWADSRRSDFLTTSSNVRQSLVAALKQAGIGLPNPDVRILIPHAPEEWRDGIRRKLFKGGINREY